MKKIDCSRSIEELSEQTQAQINQIQFDEQQKLKGIFCSVIRLILRRKNLKKNKKKYSLMKCSNYNIGELTSEQIKQQEMLRKAWNAEGSPFKGQPFDPNIVQFQN